MCARLFVLGVSILPLSTNVIFDFRIVPTVWYFYVFHFIIINITNWYRYFYFILLFPELYILDSFSYDFHIKRCAVRLYFQLLVGGPMSYLRYLCLFAHSGVQRILYCAFALFFLVLCTLCWQFFWIVHYWLPLRYSWHLFRPLSKKKKDN